MTDESPRIPPCDLCGHAQVEYGAVLVGPPREDGYAKKWHVCVSCYELIAPAAGTLLKSGPVSPSDRVPCTLENCGHMRQLDAIVDFLGMPRGGVSVLSWLRAVRTWEDQSDEWTDAIKAAYPTRSGSHDEYGTAMRMVGNRRGKAELVALVNWLLVLVARGEKLARQGRPTHR